MKYMAIVLLLLGMGTAFAQDYVSTKDPLPTSIVLPGNPYGIATPQQCVADINAWYQGMLHDDWKDLPYGTISVRAGEMNDCAITNAQPGMNKNEHKYEFMYEFYLGIEQERLLNFVNRHGLGSSFTQEDKAGQR